MFLSFIIYIFLNLRVSLFYFILTMIIFIFYLFFCWKIWGYVVTLLIIYKFLFFTIHIYIKLIGLVIYTKFTYFPKRIFKRIFLFFNRFSFKFVRTRGWIIRKIAILRTKFWQLKFFLIRAQLSIIKLKALIIFMNCF